MNSNGWLERRRDSPRPQLHNSNQQQHYPVIGAESGESEAAEKTEDLLVVTSWSLRWLHSVTAEGAEDNNGSFQSEAESVDTNGEETGVRDNEKNRLDSRWPAAKSFDLFQWENLHTLPCEDDSDDDADADEDDEDDKDDEDDEADADADNR